METVRRLAQRTLEGAIRREMPLWVSVARTFLGWSDVETGRLAEGIDMLEKQRDFLQTAHLVYWLPTYLCWLAEAYVRADRLTDARRCLDQVAQRLRTGWQLLVRGRVPSYRRAVCLTCTSQRHHARRTELRVGPRALPPTWPARIWLACRGGARGLLVTSARPSAPARCCRMNCSSSPTSRTAAIARMQTGCCARPGRLARLDRGRAANISTKSSDRLRSRRPNRCSRLKASRSRGARRDSAIPRASRALTGRRRSRSLMSPVDTSDCRTATRRSGATSR